MKPIRISNSAMDLYALCPAKYKYRYIDRLKPDKTFSSLLFGVSIDKALNYILGAIKDKSPWTTEQAISEFQSEMNTWNGQNEFLFFKSEIDEITDDPEENQWKSWNYLSKLGSVVLKTYIDKILPEISEVIDVQNKQVVKNEQGDELVLVLDFIAKTRDGREVIFDNKTASQKYPKNSVLKSQQLAIYSEFFPDYKYAGYITMGKKINEDGYVTTQIIIDQVPEEQKKISFDKMVEIVQNIKEEKFEMNLKACWSYGRPCEYTKWCKSGSMEGMIQK